MLPPPTESSGPPGEVYLQVYPDGVPRFIDSSDAELAGLSQLSPEYWARAGEHRHMTDKTAALALNLTARLVLVLEYTLCIPEHRLLP